MHKLRVYFYGSISAGIQDIVPFYRPMIRHIEQFAEVLSADIFFNPDILQGQEDGLSDEAIFKRDVAYVDESDALIGDVTIPSTGAGYEIARAELKGKKPKPVLALHRTSSGRRLTAMVNGNPHVTIGRYSTLHGAYRHINAFFKNIRHGS
mgnify:CR=1 FL=1